MSAVITGQSSVFLPDCRVWEGQETKILIVRIVDRFRPSPDRAGARPARKPVSGLSLQRIVACALERIELVDRSFVVVAVPLTQNAACAAGARSRCIGIHVDHRPNVVGAHIADLERERLRELLLYCGVIRVDVPTLKRGRYGCRADVLGKGNCCVQVGKRRQRDADRNVVGTAAQSIGV